MAENKVFEVGQLVGRRVRRSKVEYLVRWKGYGSGEDTWEPETSLLNCSSEIEKYEQTMLEKSPSPKKKPARQKSASPGRRKPSRSRSRGRSRSRSRPRTQAPKTPKRTSSLPKRTSSLLKKSQTPSPPPRRSTRSTPANTTTSKSTSDSVDLRKVVTPVKQVVPRSLQKKPTEPKEPLSLVSFRDVILALLFTAILIAILHYSEVLDLNPYLMRIKKSFSSIYSPAPTVPDQRVEK